MEEKVRIITAVDGSIDLAEQLEALMLYEGYRSMREFTLRTFEYRYPELKDLIDWETRPKRGRPTSIDRRYRVRYGKELQNEN